MRQAIPPLALLLAAGLMLFSWTPQAVSTPTYSARAGRACDTCHLDPSAWENPAVSERKCTLSCQGCHVDPAGGGLRTVSGRFYGAATVPVVATQPRPTEDWDRDWMGLFYRVDRATVYTHEFPRGPKNVAEAREHHPEDTWARGRQDHSHSLVQGRYGTLHADPVLRVGWDLRSAFLLSFTQYDNAEARAFPMQLDLGLALHPWKHAVFLAHLGARGRASGLEETLEDSRTPYLRDAMILLTEFPYQFYVKAGRFVPSYGLRIEDHTASIRRRTTVDTSVPDSRVLGVEVGAAPNYPFVHVSWFKSRREGFTPGAFDLFDTDGTWGTALNAGYRELEWSLGVSALYRRDYLAADRHLHAFGGYAAWNLWERWPGLPFTYQVEADIVKRDRTSTGRKTSHLLWQELSWLATNGLNILVGHSWEDPDRDVAFDESHRAHVGAQITPYPGITFDARVRRLWVRRDPLFDASPSPHGTDMFIQLHLWN